jgi:hypothetical protein
VASSGGLASSASSFRLADVFRAHTPPPEQITADQARVVEDIVSCRTAVLGGRLWRCDHCEYEVPVYNSCRNRHCPTCQGFESARWVESHAADLLPAPYHHLVFTVPPALHPFFLRSPRLAYRLLFAAVAATILAVCRSHLGATPGFVAVLHTWTQQLLQHPHLHCIATGGGLSLDGRRWVSARPRFFLPVRKLSRVFRGKLLAAFADHLDRNAAGDSRDSGRALLRQAAATPWVVYSKAPMAGPEQVLRYLGRYTHRVAIGDERILDVSDGHVTFAWRDRRHENRRERQRLPVAEFVRRFLLHVLPHSFVRIRHYGLLANAFKRVRLATARALLGAPAQPQPTPASEPEGWRELYMRITGRDPLACPVCRMGTLRFVALIPATATAAPRGP